MKKILLSAIIFFALLSINYPAPAKAQEDNSGTENTAITPTSYSKSACEKSCGACAPPPPAAPINRDCEGNLAYDTCVDLDRNFQSDTANFCKTSKYYRCYAKDNPNCSSSYTLECNTCPNGKNRDKNTPLSTATCYTDCKSCETKQTLGQTTYDTCADNKGGNTGNGTLCSNGATKFGCQASLNNNCQSANMEYDCLDTSFTAKAPPGTGTNPFQVTMSMSCSGNKDNMNINVGWSNPIHSSDGNYYYPGSMKLILYRPGGAVANMCINTNSQSNYTFSGDYSSTAKFEVGATAYNSTGCTGTPLAQNNKQTVNNAYCNPYQGNKPENYNLDKLTFANQPLDITGFQTTTYHLDGKAGEANSFPVRIAAQFSRGGDKLNKPYVINFVYKPKQDSTSLIYNISPAPGLMSVAKGENINFQWNTLANAKKYRLIIQTPRGDDLKSDNTCPPEDPYSSATVCKELTTTSYTIPASTFWDDTPYAWWVSAYDENGNAFVTKTWEITFSGTDNIYTEPSCDKIPCPNNLKGPNNNLVNGLGSIDLAWDNPPNTTQYFIQVFPANLDGPLISKAVSNPDQVKLSKFTIPRPKMGEGNYIILPGITYTWRVRTNTSSIMLKRFDLGWSKWSDSQTFKTSSPTSATIQALEPFNNSLVSSLTPTLRWANANNAIFYYEVELSKDKTFNTEPKTATAPVQWMYIHGGETTPLNSYHVPDKYKLEPNTKYYWRVRPRVQGDGIPVEWSDTWTFTTPGQ